jgi:hypothetical protein
MRPVYIEQPSKEDGMINKGSYIATASSKSPFMYHCSIHQLSVAPLTYGMYV